MDISRIATDKPNEFLLYINFMKCTDINFKEQ